MKKRLNVYITTGRKNVKYAYVAIKSLFVNNQGREVHLYVVSEDLTEEDMSCEYAMAAEYGHQIHILRFDEETAGKYIHIEPGDHWPIGTMSSYWLFHELLPAEVDRIIVIESDTVIVGDLSEIYDSDFGTNYMICPDPEHKPKNHRTFMESIGGDTVTFVCSLYDVQKIRRDFSLEDILKTDEIVKEKGGYSQMEFTFGLLFKGRIGYVPGLVSCIDQNERYAQELGYDYMYQAQDTVKILHFSSYKDYSKPWNPVRIMPGYPVWWEYAQGSPYYKEYFETQWELADQVKREKDHSKLMTQRNVLLMTLALFFVMTIGYLLVHGAMMYALFVPVLLLGAGAATLLIRRLLIGRKKH